MADAVVGVGLAVLSQVSQVGKALQKEGVKELPELDCTSLKLYLHSRRWMLGITLDIAGALVGLASLALLPISIAQPIFCNGIVVLALFSTCYLKEKLGLFDWSAVALCILGTSLLAFTLEATDWAGVDVIWLERKVGIVLACAVALIALLELGAERAKQQHAIAMTELFTGTQAGVCIGAGNSGLGCGLQLLRIGDAGTRTIALAFVLLGLLFTSAHPVFANRGYKTGRVVIITAYLSLVSLATGVFMGIFVLGESWPSDPLPSLMRIAGLACIGASVFVLSGTDFIGCTPRGVYGKLNGPAVPMV